jgi:hypothetical protein
MNRAGVLHIESVEPHVFHEAAHAFPRSGRLIISEACKELVRSDTRDLVSGAVEPSRERAGAQLLGIVHVELDISPGESKWSSVDCGRKSGIVVAVSWFRHCWPCSSQNPDKIQVVTGVTPQAKPSSHTIERVNHAPARKVTAPASSIMEEASETP